MCIFYILFFKDFVKLELYLFEHSPQMHGRGTNLREYHAWITKPRGKDPIFKVRDEYSGLTFEASSPSLAW